MEFRCQLSRRNRELFQVSVIHVAKPRNGRRGTYQGVWVTGSHSQHCVTNTVGSRAKLQNTGPLLKQILLFCAFEFTPNNNCNNIALLYTNRQYHDIKLSYPDIKLSYRFSPISCIDRQKSLIQCTYSSVIDRQPEMSVISRPQRNPQARDASPPGDYAVGRG